MNHVLSKKRNDSRTTRHSITFSSVELPYSFTLTLAHRFLATFLDLVPFFCAGGLALTVTTLFVLLTEDDPNDSKVLGKQQSQFTSYQQQFLGLSEKEREWSMRSHSSYYGYSPFQTNVTGPPASITVTA